GPGRPWSRPRGRGAGAPGTPGVRLSPLPAGGAPPASPLPDHWRLPSSLVPRSSVWASPHPPCSSRRSRISSPRPPEDAPAFKPGRNPLPREAGHRSRAGTPTARLRGLYGHCCHSGRMRTAYRCRAYPDEAQQQVLARTFGLGVTGLAVTSDGDRVANPRHLEHKARNLARYQRRLARCQKGSANRGKAAAKVARAHRKVRDARQDFLHRASTRMVREHDVIVIEDLAVANMVRNRHLARAISGCGWGEFGRQLEYKCAWYGRRLIVIDRWYPSSTTCSACGHLLAKLSLSTRYWTCPSCRARHDRDINAAKNILAAGLAVSACGAGVRLQGAPLQRPAVRQEPQPARAGIPVLQRGE